MDKGILKVNEIFYSLQGEGRRAGDPSIFIRLSDCDLTCSFCDTEFESGKEMTIEAIYQEIRELTKCRWIVWTGGEPALQLNDGVVEQFKSLGYKQAIETNGNNKIPTNLDWVTLSPKVAEHVVKKNLEGQRIDEVKYVINPGRKAIPAPALKSTYKFLSPEFSGDIPNMASLKKCIEFTLAHPEWSISTQQHKIWRVR